MIENKHDYIYPDDDGRAKRPWITDSKERGCSACERVMEVLEKRPWLRGKAVETIQNSVDDEHGVDIFVPMNRALLKFLGIVQTERGVPFQIKSGDTAVRKFLRKRKIYDGKSGKYLFRDGEYSFVLNGQNAKDVILADMVGQMVALASRFDISEVDVLKFLAVEMADKEAVLRYGENRVIILDQAWYREYLGKV